LAALLLGAAAGSVWLVRAYSRPSIRMDGIGYYLPLASVVFDRDLDLNNEVAHLDPYMRRRYFIAPDGRIVDPFAVGAAVLWSPAVWVGAQLDPARDTFRKPGHWENASPGFQPRYVRIVAVMTGLFALLGGAILFVTLRARTGTAAAWAGCLGAALGTPVFYYALADPSYSHAASFLCSSALVAGAVLPRRVPVWALGIVWGSTCLVRWQDAVLGIVLVPRLAVELDAARRIGALRIARCGLEFVLPALAVFLPQMLFWNSLYGRPLLVPMGPGFMEWFRPHVLPLLASTWHGAFVWSPLLLAGVAGIACVPERALRWALWAAVGLAIYVSAAVSDWWGSAGFGARRLVCIAPIAGLGLAHATAWWMARTASRKRQLVAAGVLALGIAWSLRLAQYQLAGLLPTNPGNFREYALRDPAYTDPAKRLYGWWDHPRLWRDVWFAERQMWRGAWRRRARSPHDRRAGRRPARGGSA
jgi:hypothetical protein